jgi:hypothetical protein
MHDPNPRIERFLPKMDYKRLMRQLNESVLRLALRSAVEDCHVLFDYTTPL